MRAGLGITAAVEEERVVLVVNRSPGSNKLAWDLTGDRDEEDDDAAAPLRSLAAKRTERRSEAENESPHLTSAHASPLEEEEEGKTDIGAGRGVTAGMGHVGGAGERGGVPERSLHRGPVGGWARAAVGVVGTMGRVVMRVWGTWGPDVGGGPVVGRGSPWGAELDGLSGVCTGTRAPQDACGI